MSISKDWVGCASNREKVLAFYRSAEILTIEQIAERLQTTYHNVAHVLKKFMAPEERKALSKVRYSASKTGNKNPMLGKTGEAHHNWKGECDDGKGYLTCLCPDGKRRYVHHVVMAEALGLAELPDVYVVHHIDGNPKNNAIDNLALVTRPGHVAVHFLQAKDALQFKLRKLSIAEALKYMT